jgi:hypothetical protein
MYHAITSRRKLSFLSHGTDSWPFLFYYTNYITIIFYYTYYFINRNQYLGANAMQKTCQLAHPPRGIRKHTIQEHQELNHQSPTCCPHFVRFRNPPIGLADVRQPSCTQFRFELITQSINTCGNSCAPPIRDWRPDSKHSSISTSKSCCKPLKLSTIITTRVL